MINESGKTKIRLRDSLKLKIGYKLNNNRGDEMTVTRKRIDLAKGFLKARLSQALFKHSNI